MSPAIARHPRRRWFGSALLTAALAGGLTLVFVRWIPPPEAPPDRRGASWRAILFLLRSFPHWDDVPQDRNELFGAYRARLAAAERSCDDDRSLPCPEQLRVLRELFGEVGNGHTEVTIFGDLGRPAVLVEPVGESAVITGVVPGSDAEREGLEPGMTIEAVDGRPVVEALAAVPGWRLAYAAPHSRRYRAYRSLLEGPAGTRVEVRVSWGQTRRVAFLERERILSIREEEDPGDEGDAPAERQISAEALDDGLGYLAIEGFTDDDLVAELDRALGTLAGAPGLIVDLRFNGGGHADQTRGVLARFWREPLALGEDCIIEQEAGETETRCHSRTIEPGGRGWTGPVALLIDETVFSAGEVAAHALCRSGRARCFGRPTAGETDSVVHFDIPGASIGIASAVFRPAFGPDAYGVGVEPHVSVELDARDLHSGVDTDLEVARRWLLEWIAADSGGDTHRATSTAVDLAASVGRDPVRALRE